MLDIRDTQERKTHPIHCTCPSCQKSGDFTYLGKQEYPAAVAEKVGVPAVSHLWTCSNCLSTINEVDLPQLH